ncbi:Hypothetical predicted protein [Octopus vulgaris]|uniref:Uncharacterized protein n=1 Tax=Octopus vulgaris TaxID=6645 RepID=A0AA36C0Z4_OCTVU|nr:Hypothetical predicted protein [Octopus vulgaris]
MWSEVFEAGITTNAYLSEMWRSAEEEGETEGEERVCGESRGREIEFALRYFDEKYRPLRLLMAKPSASKLIEVEGQGLTYTEQATTTAAAAAMMVATTSDTTASSNNSINNININATTTSERKRSTCDSFNYLQLDSSADPGSAALTFDTSHRDRPKCEGTVSTDYKDEMEEEAEENHHQQQQQQHQEHSVASHGCYPMPDQRFDVSIPQQGNPEGRFLGESKYNIWDTTPSQNEKYEVDLDMAESGIPSNGAAMEGGECEKDLELDGDPLNILRSELGSQLGKSRMVCSSGIRGKIKARLKRNIDVPETKQHLEVSLDNLRKHLCVAPTSSFEILHSCPNNFEKLKYLRIKERESPMVRLSCAFQQGYYLELLFPGRKIHTTATATEATSATTTTNTNNYLQRLFDLNMSLSYSRQLRQFYKNFRRYRRLLHLNVPLRSILRNISRIREKIESSEQEERFWSTLPTTTMRVFYECYGKWFGLALCDVYSLFDVVDNYPSGTAEQFLDNKCVRLYECEGHMKAVKWLNCSADKPRYLLVYRTMDYVHCLLAEKKGDRWTYEVSFDKDKNTIIHVGIYVCIKSH